MVPDEDVAAVVARSDGGLVRLEGLHAVKHALRFGARIEVAVTPDADRLRDLAAQLCPDLLDVLEQTARPMPPADFRSLCGRREPNTPVLAWADRPSADRAAAQVAGSGGQPLVLLDDPRHAGNAGAVIRVAAAAGAGAVLLTGALDPWSPAVLRAAAGLHFAVPVATVELPLVTGRSIVAFDPEGDLFVPADLPTGAVLAFGGERHGLSADLLQQADAVSRLPMQPKVSSLNLATAVAAVLYAVTFAQT